MLGFEGFLITAKHCENAQAVLLLSAKGLEGHPTISKPSAP